MLSPVVAGVLVPTMLIVSLVIIPYFNVNIEAQGLFLKDRTRRVRLFYIVAAGMTLFLLAFKVYAAAGPELIIVVAMIVAANSTPESPSRIRRYLAAKPFAYMGNDLVLVRTDCADRRRHFLPRTWLVVGFSWRS